MGVKMINKGCSYRIKGNSKYFKDKYGTSNPIIEIEDKDTVIWNGGWGLQQGNPACLLFAMRSGIEKLPWNGTVYYGKIGIGKEGARLGELVHESELEELK
jgi:hypothetical protein